MVGIGTDARPEDEELKCFRQLWLWGSSMCQSHPSVSWRTLLCTRGIREKGLLLIWKDTVVQNVLRRRPNRTFDCLIHWWGGMFQSRGEKNQDGKLWIECRHGVFQSCVVYDAFAFVDAAVSSSQTKFLLGETNLEKPWTLICWQMLFTPPHFISPTAVVEWKLKVWQM